MSFTLPSKRTIVCLHGFGSSSDIFKDLKQSSLLKDYDFITPDYPGHKNAQDAGCDGDPLTFVADKIAQSIREKGQKAILVGHSMGGAVALLIAERHPELVEALVSIEGNLHGGLLSRTISACTTDTEVAEKRESLTATARESKRLSWHKWADDINAIEPRILKSYADSLVNVSKSGRLPEIFNRLTCPKLYIYGDDYNIQDLDQIDTTLTCHVENTGHFVMQDDPTYCARLIQQVIRTIPGHEQHIM